MNSPPVILDGESLMIEDTVRVAMRGAPVYLTEDPALLADLEASREFYLECIKSGRYAYGGGTGVGSNVTHILYKEDRNDVPRSRAARNYSVNSKH